MRISLGALFPSPGSSGALGPLGPLGPAGEAGVIYSTSSSGSYLSHGRLVRTQAVLNADNSTYRCVVSSFDCYVMGTVLVALTTARNWDNDLFI